jgi:hypothetical protein
MLRTVTIGLMWLCLVATVVAPAIAQTADPLGLIGAGALIPYLGSGTPTGAMSLLLLSSPVGSSDVLMFFFDSTCTRGGPAVSTPLTANDVALIRIDDIGVIPTTGLVAIAAPNPGGFSLEPLSNPIHARVSWINAAKDFVRILEPIAIQHAEAPDTTQVWNPLRTAASFYAEPESATSTSALILICPTKSVIADTFPPPTFPKLLPKPVAAGSTPISLRVYDADEALLRVVSSTCGCVSQIPLKTLDAIYSDVVSAPFGTYTEISGGLPGSRSFTGYLATNAAGRDRFARLHNGNVLSLQGTLSPGSR